MNLTVTKLAKERAIVKTVIAYLDTNTETCFAGIIKGEIATALSGTGGFGYDPLFIPEGYSETFGALPPEIKLKLSHRSRAIKALFEHLKYLT